jgi:hypothetical protein
MCKGFSIKILRRFKMIHKILPFLLLLTLVYNNKVLAHCDGIDGPVVKAAIAALQNKDVNLVLIWVQKADEEEVIKAFNNTLKVRELSAEAKELADVYFFETVVRLHRAGEGEPYTGLKGAGRDLGPVIPLADHSIEKGSVEELKELIIHSAVEKLEHNFQKVNSLKNYNDVTEGRDFVEAYVQFIHFAEKLYEFISHFEGHTNHSEEIHKH